MYATGTDWKNWMKDFRYGTLVFIPNGDLKATVDQLRAEYDPVSARTSMAHVTVTQPFAKAPTNEDITKLADILKEYRSFDITVGPATTSPNKRLLWLDISNKELIVSLRDRLHATGLFRTDLPLTKGFIPHMTISEAGREPSEVQAINESLNAQLDPWESKFASIVWIIPDEDFICQEYKELNLGRD